MVIGYARRPIYDHMLAIEILAFVLSAAAAFVSLLTT